VARAAARPRPSRLSTLEKAGYIKQTKVFEDRKPRT